MCAACFPQNCHNIINFYKICLNLQDILKMLVECSTILYVIYKLEKILAVRVPNGLDMSAYLSMYLMHIHTLERAFTFPQMTVCVSSIVSKFYLFALFYVLFYFVRCGRWNLLYFGYLVSIRYVLICIICWSYSMDSFIVKAITILLRIKIYCVYHIVWNVAGISSFQLRRVRLYLLTTCQTLSNCIFLFFVFFAFKSTFTKVWQCARFSLDDRIQKFQFRMRNFYQAIAAFLFMSNEK